MACAVVNGELHNLLLLDAQVCVTYHVRTDDAEALTRYLGEELQTEAFADETGEVQFSLFSPNREESSEGSGAW